MSRTFFYALIVLLVLVTGIGFAALNAVPVTIDYFLGRAEVSLPWALLAALLAGFLLGLLVSISAILRAHGQVRRVRKESRLMEAEIRNLRNLPIRRG